jgi:flagellar basal-body rod protein FlgG
MFHSLDVAATGMAAQETKLDTIANNLANADTVGYKRQDAQFEDLLYQTVRGPAAANGGAPSGVSLGTGTRVVGTPRSFAQGSTQQTGKTYDVAIEGEGFLVVQRPSGEQAYTRAGALATDSTGRLVNGEGLPIEPVITIPADATSVTITSDGVVNALRPGQSTPSQLGQIQLATFPNATGLTAIGHNLFTPGPASGEATLGNPGTDGRGSVRQGMLESSNVEVVTEMIGLIRAQRSYEINSKVISAADEMLRNATQAR